MREIEAQAIGRHQRTLLRDMIAEHLAQRLVQKMRRRMISPDRARRHDPHRNQAGAPTFERAIFDCDVMHIQIAGFLLGSENTRNQGAIGSR